MAAAAMAVLDVDGGGGEWRRWRWRSSSTAVVANRGSGGMKPTAPMAASSTAVDGVGGDDVVAAAVDERRPLDYGGRRR